RLGGRLSADPNSQFLGWLNASTANYHLDYLAVSVFFLMGRSPAHDNFRVGLLFPFESANLSGLASSCSARPLCVRNDGSQVKARNPHSPPMVCSSANS